LSLIP